jgi:hypothetical protein
VTRITTRTVANGHGRFANRLTRANSLVDRGFRLSTSPQIAWPTEFENQKSSALWNRSQCAHVEPRKFWPSSAPGHRAPGLIQKETAMLRFSLFSAIATLAVVVAPLMSASAGQKNYAPTYQNATSHAFGVLGSADALSLNTNQIGQGNLNIGKSVGQDNYAPTHQTATSGAFALGGDASAASVNTNLVQQGNAALSKHAYQTNSAPTTQNAVSTAVSVGGDASAISANANGVSQGNLH